MTFTEAAAQVLRLVGKPLHYKEITDVAIEKNLLSHVGKSPAVTMGARLAALVKKAEKDNPLVRVKPGVFALREWDDKRIEEGLADRTPALQLLADNGADEGTDKEAEGESSDAPPDTDAAADEDSAPPAAVHVPVPDDDEEAAPDEEERARAELAASGTEIFAPEEDDDEPIFAEPAEEDAERAERESTSRRRRRRRRRRGGPAEKNRVGNGLPSYTVSDAPPEGVDVEVEARGKDNDRGRRDQGVVLDGLAGVELADGIVGLLSGYDRNNGPVSTQKLAEAAHRKGRISGEVPHIQALFTAVVRADNLRRTGEGLRPRFSVAGGRIGLTDWLLDNDLARAERDVLSAVDRYREVARRSLLRQLQQLPQRAVGELVLLLLEQAGVSGLSVVRRPGISGSELHLAGTLCGAGGEVQAAVVVRRDGRDVGREQVTDLRGALHHYGPAAAGWILTTGQVLSGAHEEARVPGATPVTLLDGAALVKLCEQHGVAVTETQVALPLPDADLFDALRAG